jgi:gliding motility-associated-like protein
VVASFQFDYENEFSPLQNLSSPDCIYEWILPDGSISNLFQPIFETQSGQEYTVFLSVQNEYGCEATSVEFYDPPLRIFIPTAFTPDGDGLNDIFKAEGQFVGSFHLMIFERGGRLVFESHDMKTGWRGDNISQEDFSAGNGIYAYRYVAKSITGAVLEGKGQVLMIR